MKIAVYAIALNEAQFVERFVTSALDADVIVVGDTGSTDDTTTLLDRFGAVVVPVSVSPWRFDDARNAVLSWLPDDIDVCVSLDMDEVLEPGWRKIIEEHWRPETTHGKYMFAWSHHPDGSPAVEYWYEKIHSRRGIRWRNACHEFPATDPRITRRETILPGLRIHHWPDNRKPRSSYLPLLELTRDENPNCARTAHYLGREYFFYGRDFEAFAELTRHLTMPESNWAYERCASLRYLSKILRRAGKPIEAVAYLQRAAGEAPDLRDPWVDMAENYHDLREWDLCLSAAQKALAIAAVPTVYMNDPRSFRAAPHDFAGLALWNLGRKDEALAQAELALKQEPNDERLRNNVESMKAPNTADDK